MILTALVDCIDPIQAEPEYRIDEKQLDLFYVTSSTGKQIPLSTLVTIEQVMVLTILLIQFIKIS